MKGWTYFIGFYLLVCLFYSLNADEDGNPDEVSNEIIENGGFSSEDDSFEECDHVDLHRADHVARVGPNSKYFVGISEKIEISEVAAFCNNLLLQTADIRNNFELLSIESFLNGHAGPDELFSLGVNDVNSEGKFVEYDGSSMTFHSFMEEQPNNYMNMENCVALSRHPLLPRWVYVDITCSTPVTPMCMFKTDDRCYFSSPLSSAKKAEGFQLVGSSYSRDYYVGLAQVPRSEAQASCQQEGYFLVDFSTGFSNNQMLYDLTKKWIIKNYYYERIAFWTGGTLSYEYHLDPTESIRFVFQESGKPLSDLSDWPSLDWATGEPEDNSGSGLDGCISVFLPSPFIPDESVFAVSTTNCRIPHYPLCYKEKNVIVIPEPQTDNETTTVSPLPEYCLMDSIPLNLTLDTLSTDELLELTTKVGYPSLSSDIFRFKWNSEITWLQNLVKVIFETGSQTCPDDVVPKKFTNIMHNLIILYYNALEKFDEPKETIVAKIVEETEFFIKCKEGLGPLMFKSAGGIPVAIGNYSVIIPRELVEEGATLDLIIDAYWFYFQTVMGACYPKLKSSQTKWMSDTYHNIIRYTMEVFEHRWVTKGIDAPDYGIFMGDLDMAAAMYGLRACAISTFTTNSITDLYFPRQLYLDDGISQKINRII